MVDSKNAEDDSSGSSLGPCKIGAYSLVGTHDDLPARVDWLGLDQNVTIDFQNVYFHANAKFRESVRDLLLAFPRTGYPADIDLIYGFALGESGTLRDGTRNDTLRMEWALFRMTQWSKDEILYELSEGGAPVSRDPHWQCPGDELWERFLEKRSKKEGRNALPLLASSYCSLLRMMQLYTGSEWRRKGAHWALDQLWSWMDADLSISMSLEYALAVDLFTGKDQKLNDARDVVKYSGNEKSDKLADNLWNAAWDFLFVRWTSGMLAIEHGKPSALVTRNDDPWEILQRSNPGVMLSDGEHSKVIVACRWANSAIGYPEGMVSRDAAYARARRRDADGDAGLRRALDAIERVEREMGIERSTIRAFQEEDAAWKQERQASEHAAPNAEDVFIAGLRPDPGAQDWVNSSPWMTSWKSDPELHHMPVPAKDVQKAFWPTLIVDLHDPDRIRSAGTMRRLEQSGLFVSGAPARLLDEWGYVLWEDQILVYSRRHGRFRKFLFQRFITPDYFFDLLDETPLLLFVLNGHGDRISKEVLAQRANSGLMLTGVLYGDVLR